MDLPTGFIAEETGSDGRLLQLMKRFGASVWELVMLNILFVLCCLPVVTAGAALGGLTVAVFRLAEGSGRGVWRDFKEGARKHGRVFTGYLLTEVLIGGTLVFAMIFYGRRPSTKLLGIFCMGAFLFFMVAVRYLHCLRVCKKFPLKKALRYSVLLALLGLTDFGFWGLEALLVWLGIGMLPHSLPLFLLIIPAAESFIGCFAASRTIRRYITGLPETGG